MFRMGFVKGGVIDNRRFHRPLLVRIDGFGIQMSLEFFLDAGGNFLLVLRGAKDDAPVLGSPIVPLPIQSGRIVKGVKEAHQVLENFRRLGSLGRQFNVQNLHVARASAAHLAVAGIFHAVRVGVHKADLGRGDASGVFLLKVLDNVFFRSPVAPVVVVNMDSEDTNDELKKYRSHKLALIY